MIKKIRLILSSFAVVGIIAGTGLVLTPSTALADHEDGHQCSARLLTFPTWYRGLVDKTTCQIKAPDSGSAGSAKSEGKSVSTFVFTIVLNIVEILLQLVGYAAVGYIIYGGFKYLTSAGSADRITAGRKIITNALIGLVISFMSIGIVNLISTNINSQEGDGCNAVADGRIDPDCVGIARVGGQQGINGILNTVYTVAGTVAVIVIIVSAIFYVISQGEAAKIKRAKDGILYAIVGLVIILLAFVITNFVIGRF